MGVDINTDRYYGWGYGRVGEFKEWILTKFKPELRDAYNLYRYTEREEDNPLRKVCEKYHVMGLYSMLTIVDGTEWTVDDCREMYKEIMFLLWKYQRGKTADKTGILKDIRDICIYSAIYNEPIHVG